MRTKLVVPAILVVAVILSLGIMLIPDPYVDSFWAHTPWGQPEGTGDGDNTGDNGGGVTGQATIRVLDGAGNVVEGRLFFAWLYQGSLPSPGADQCNQLPGYYWDPDVSDCLPNPTQEEPPDSGLPDKQVISGDNIQYIEFILDWVEVQGYHVQQDSLKVRTKGKGLLANQDWSSVLEDATIEPGDFEFTSHGEGAWTARTKNSPAERLRIDVQQFASDYNAFFPIQIRFFFYAQGLTQAGQQIKSDRVEFIREIRSSSLSASGNPAPILLLALRRIMEVGGCA